MRRSLSRLHRLLSVLWLGSLAAASSARALPPERPASPSAQAPAPAKDPAQAADVLVVAGDVPHPGPLRIDELRALPAKTAAWTLHGQSMCRR